MPKSILFLQQVMHWGKKILLSHILMESLLVLAFFYAFCS